MTRNDIICLARQAGIQSPEEYDGHSQDCPWIATTDELTRFAQLAVEAAEVKKQGTPLPTPKTKIENQQP